jgi:hypothetical protein
MKIQFQRTPVSVKAYFCPLNVILERLKDIGDRWPQRILPFGVLAVKSDR